VLNELGYDRWLPEYDRIFTIETVSTPPDRAPAALARSAVEIRAAMEKDFAEIESFTRLHAGSAPIKVGNTLFPEKAFRIDLAPLVFISAGASVLMIAWITIAAQAAKVAVKNPIYALRHE
jgi:hypothetical protein